MGIYFFNVYCKFTAFKNYFGNSPAMVVYLELGDER